MLIQTISVHRYKQSKFNSGRAPWLYHTNCTKHLVVLMSTCVCVKHSELRTPHIYEQSYVGLCMPTDWSMSVMLFDQPYQSCAPQVIHVQSVNHIFLKESPRCYAKYTGCVHTISWHCGHNMKEQRVQILNQSAHFERFELLPFGQEFPHYEIMSCYSVDKVWTLPSIPKQWGHWQHFLIVCLPLCHFKDLMHNCRYYIANFIPCRAIDVLQSRKSLRVDNALPILALDMIN